MSNMNERNDIFANINKAFDAMDKWLSSRESVRVLNSLACEQALTSYGYSVSSIVYHPDSRPYSVSNFEHGIRIDICIPDPSIKNGGKVRFYYEYCKEKLYLSDEECVIVDQYENENQIVYGKLSPKLW